MQNARQKVYNLLRWSEQYTQTDMVYLAKGGFWLTLGQVISSISTFVLAIAFANLVPRETYGIYKYILSIVGVLSLTALPGLSTAITRSVSQGFEGSYAEALKARVRWGILGGLASLIIAVYYYINANQILSYAFLIAAFFIPIMDTLGIYTSLLAGQKRFRLLTKYSSINQIAATVILIGAIYLTDNLLIITLSYFISWTITRGIILLIIKKRFPTNDKKDPDTISYGKHLTLMKSINSMASFLDRILLWHFLGAVEVAIYSFAIAIPNQISALLKNISTLSLPKFSERSKKEIKSGMAGKIIKFLIPILLITVLYILLAPLIFQILFPQYPESVFYSQVFAISLIAAASLLPSVALEAQKAKKELYIKTFTIPLIEIILLVIFVFLYGILGAIIVRLMTRFLYFGISFWLLKKY